jgi:glycosyltransferase involved in cell wall biosynthesis
MASRRIFVTTAMGALTSESAPVGGGVAVLEALLPHLAAADDFDVTLLRPGSSRAELHRDGYRVVTLPVPCLAQRPIDRMLHAGEREYARFALEWERCLSEAFASIDPRAAVVLANDVSEGPPFRELAERGFAQLALYHVVVGEFFSRQYLGGFSPAWTAKAWRALRRAHLDRLAPELLSLVWDKESQAARYADAVVPSAPLGRALADLYPASGIASRTTVVPWGVLGTPDPARRDRRAATLARYDLEPGQFCLLTLSRISREKRLDRLLAALERLESESPRVAARLAWIVAGAPAYMGGGKTYERLKSGAARLQHVSVRFAGYVSGAAKWDLFSAADLFCSCSAYEAYGLTIAQALASGTPVLSTEHQGARSILTPAMGHVVASSPREIAGGIRSFLDRDLSGMRRSAAAWGSEHRFAVAAERIADCLRGNAMISP